MIPMEYDCLLNEEEAVKERLALGTRHRTAISVNQVSESLVIVVSQKKGRISMALGGRLYPNVGTFALLKKLENEEGADSI